MSVNSYTVSLGGEEKATRVFAHQLIVSTAGDLVFVDEDGELLLAIASGTWHSVSRSSDGDSDD